MMTRRDALRAMALTAAALSMGGPAAAQDAKTPAAAPKPAEPPAGPFTVPPLGYAFDALEPVIDAQTMQIHHDKHHATYVTNLNKAVAAHPELARKPVEESYRGLAEVPEAIRTAVRNHGGGHSNHSLFWAQLKKGGPAKPGGALATAIDQSFGGLAPFQEKFSQAATSVFGSGWAWLSLDDGKLIVETTPNQDSPWMNGHRPVLGLDVWEHAYYLKHQNRRADYIAAFQQVIDWPAIEARYQALLKS